MAKSVTDSPSVADQEVGRVSSVSAARYLIALEARGQSASKPLAYRVKR